MGVYKPQKSRFWHYEFQFKGRRFHGSTGVEGKRQAEAVERKIRQDAALGLLDATAGMTLDHGAGLWWSEVGQHLRTAATVERRLETLIRIMGGKTRLVDITTRHVAAAIETRRGETYQKAPDTADKKARRYALANATVNADIISPLRRIMRRAEAVWEVKPLARINWKALTLKEPEPEVVLYTPEQQAAWLAQCDEVTAEALRMLLRYGLRLGELFFKPTDVDPSGPRLKLNNRKAGANLLPLRADDGRMLAARAGRAMAEDLETVWYEEHIAPALGKKPARITLIPLTYYGLQARLRGAAKRAKIDGRRLIHGTRHHAGTAFLSQHGNLKLTQQLLGHADIKSTLRYAHALEADLRAALEEELPGTKLESSPPGKAVQIS